MARIREYTQQTSVSGEVGGRRATSEDFGFGREMQNFGETVVNVATYIKQDQERKEVEDASVKMSEARQQWTETYLKRQDSAMPGDISMAPTMKQEMDEYFGSMAEGYSSRAAKKYVKLHGTGMTTDFFARGLQYQQAQAGQKARSDFLAETDVQGNTVFADPTQYNSIIAKRKFDMEFGIGPRQYIRNDPNASKLEQDAVQKIAWNAGQGALKNPAARGFIVGNIQGSEVQTTQDVFQTLMPSIFKTEGGYVASDGKRGATKYGINGEANGLTPEQIKNLTPEQAQQIYKNNYWDKYQLDTLPASSIPVVFDGVINHRSDFAQSLVNAAKSGATPQQLGEMRKAEYTRLIQTEPDTFKKYEKSWMGRVDKAIAESSKVTQQQSAPLTVIDESKLPAWYADMSPESKDRFLREALDITKRERSVADQALSRTIQDHQAELTMYGGKLKSPALPQSAFIGKPLEWEKYNSMLKAGEKVQLITNAPEAEQAQLLESLKPKHSSIPGVFDYQTDLYTKAVKMVGEINKKRMEDPISFATSSGFSSDNPIKQIDTADPQKLAQALIARDPQASAVNKTYGGQFRMLSKPESEFLRKNFDQMDTKAQSAWIGTVRGSLSPEKFRSVIEQMASGDKALIGAGIIASSQFGGDTRDSDADSILIGRNILTRHLKGGGNEQERAFKAAGLPNAGDAYKLASTKLQGLIGIPEAQKEAMIETAMAHYIGTANKKNSFVALDLSGSGTESNQKEFLKSLDAVTPVSKIGASTVLRPYGMSDAQFQERMDANVRTRYQLQRGQYSVMMTGGGYQAIAGGIPVGEPFQLRPVGDYSNEGRGMSRPLDPAVTPNAIDTPWYQSRARGQFVGVQTYSERTGKGIYEESNKELAEGARAALEWKGLVGK